MTKPQDILEPEIDDFLHTLHSSLFEIQKPTTPWLIPTIKIKRVGKVVPRYSTFRCVADVDYGIGDEEFDELQKLVEACPLSLSATTNDPSQWFGNVASLYTVANMDKPIVIPGIRGEQGSISGAEWNAEYISCMNWGAEYFGVVGTDERERAEFGRTGVQFHMAVPSGSPFGKLFEEQPLVCLAYTPDNENNCHLQGIRATHIDNIVFSMIRKWDPVRPIFNIACKDVPEGCCEIVGVDIKLKQGGWEILVETRGIEYITINDN